MSAVRVLALLLVIIQQQSLLSQGYHTGPSRPGPSGYPTHDDYQPYNGPDVGHSPYSAPEKPVYRPPDLTKPPEYHSQPDYGASKPDYSDGPDHDYAKPDYKPVDNDDYGKPSGPPSYSTPDAHPGHDYSAPDHSSGHGYSKPDHLPGHGYSAPDHSSGHEYSKPDHLPGHDHEKRDHLPGHGYAKPDYSHGYDQSKPEDYFHSTGYDSHPSHDYSQGKPPYGGGYKPDYGRESYSAGGYGSYPPIVPYEGSQKPPGVINYGYKYKYGISEPEPVPPPPATPQPTQPAKPLFSFRTLGPARGVNCYHAAPTRITVPLTNCTTDVGFYFDIVSRECLSVPDDYICVSTPNFYSSFASCQEDCLPQCEEFSQTGCGYNPFPVVGKGYSYDQSQNDCNEVDFILGCEGEGILFPRQDDCFDSCVHG